MENLHQLRPYLRPSSLSGRHKDLPKGYLSREASLPQSQLIKSRRPSQDEKLGQGFSRKGSHSYERDPSSQNDIITVGKQKYTENSLRDMSKPALYQNLLSQYKIENIRQKVHFDNDHRSSTKTRSRINSYNSRLNHSAILDSRRRNMYISDEVQGLDSIEMDQDKQNHSDISIDQFLIFVPKHKRITSASAVSPTAKPFHSFEEMGRKARGVYKKLLKDISAYNRCYKTLDNNNTTSEMDQPRLIKSFLKFNKEQQKSFMMETEKEEEKILSFVTQKQNEEIQKRKKMPPVKVFPILDNSHDKSYELAYTPDSNRPNISKWISDFNKRLDQERVASLNQLADKLYWQAPMGNNYAWVPESREGHTLTLVGNKLVLYGGISTSAIHDIAVFNLEKQVWSKPEITNEMTFIGRHGHTACQFRDNVIVFGGQDNFNPAIKIRQCLNDIKLYNAKHNRLQSVHPSELMIGARRNHAATIYNNKMYVYGGLNAEGKALKDIWMLNLENFLWSQLDISDEKEVGIAFHTMCSYVKEAKPKSIFEKKSKNKTPLDGIYVFGGKDAKGNVLNTLKTLVITSEGSSWKYPQTQGHPPVPRYCHTMTINSSLGLLAIYGGRSVENEMDNHFNNVCLLDLNIMKWLPTIKSGVIPDSLQYNHAAVMIGSKLIVFGGLGQHEYITENFTFIETDQTEVRKLSRAHHTTEDSTLGVRKNRYNDSEDTFYLARKKDNEQNISSKRFTFVTKHQDLNSHADQSFETFQKKGLKTWQPIPVPEKRRRDSSIRPRTLISKNVSAPSIQAEK